jgi:hypothetical protein
MKIMFIATRTRPDVLTTVNHLGSKNTRATEENMIKLNKLIRYWSSTSHLGITYSRGGCMKVYEWVDASYASHDDAKSHSGIIIGIGKEPIAVILENKLHRI